MRRIHTFLTTKAGLLAALLGVAALGTAAATTLGATAFTAQVGGTGTFQSGTLLLSKSINGGTACLSSSNASGSIGTNINSSCTGSDFGSGVANVIGTPVTTTVALTNQGSITATHGLTLSMATACSAAGAPVGSSVSTLDPTATGTDTSGYCANVWVTIFNASSGNCLFPAQTGACPALSSSSTLSSLQSGGAITLASSLAPSATTSLTITTELGTAATNADQGLVASLPMTYTLNQ